VEIGDRPMLIPFLFPITLSAYLGGLGDEEIGLVILDMMMPKITGVEA
jgi:hypothetical protein